MTHSFSYLICQLRRDYVTFLQTRLDAFGLTVGLFPLSHLSRASGWPHSLLHCQTGCIRTTVTSPAVWTGWRKSSAPGASAQPAGRPGVHGSPLTEQGRRILR